MLQQHAAEHVHRIEDAHVNWYLVQEGTRLTAVDAGHPRSWSSLLGALDDMGRSLADLEAIVLTHGHFDHVGFAERARRELGVPVHAPRGEAWLAAHPWRYEYEGSRLRTYARHPSGLGVLTAMVRAGALRVPGVREVQEYEGGQELDVPGRPVAISTPGHTHDHCALLLADRGVLLTGDALVTFDPYTTDVGPQIVSGAATADRRQAVASLDVIAATRAATVLPGHGEVWHQGVAVAVECARERVAR